MKKYDRFLFIDNKTNLLRNKTSIERLVKMSNVKEPSVPVAIQCGYGQVATGMVSLLSRFPNNVEDDAIGTARLFETVIGEYNRRIFETINPLYWINLVIYLPKNILSYLGLNTESVIIKIAQIFYWILTPIILIFRNDITTKLIDYISSLS
ncbi:hypothetical protein KHQ81_12930 [Mycoplasmatota bacterium]|nr:hypothetical protein KHQ81_12930 [Mycoplasmatota bacterium]